METFLITVAVLEGRHYIWMNMDSVVMVSVGGKRKYTGIRNKSDCPFYNEYFVFEFFTSLEEILDKQISITVIQPGNICRKRKTLGYLALDVATVWNQVEHQFYHKWAILSPTKNDPSSGPRGYIKLDISVLVRGEAPKIPANVFNDEIENNLLLPEGARNNERQTASYIFDVYKCLNLAYPPSILFKDTQELTDDKEAIKGPNSYVEITFAGKTVRTTTQKRTSFPEFNERLTIIDLFPPLCQRIKIGIFTINRLKRRIHSKKFVSLNMISSSKEDGFLPTFGPVILNTTTNNELEGYVGSILLSMKTELNEFALDIKNNIIVSPISPIKQQTYFQNEDITLLTCLFEVTAINKKYAAKPISIRMTIGESFLQKTEEIVLNVTEIWKPKRISKDLFALGIQDQKPCLWILRELPYHKIRMFNSNILSKIRDSLKQKLLEIEDLYYKPGLEDYFAEIEEKLQNSIDYVQSSCKLYLDIASSYNENNTCLDKERLRICIKEMSEIVAKVQDINIKMSKRKAFRKLKKMFSIIESLVDDIQDSWPSLMLWIVQGVTKIALYQTTPRDLIYSPIDEERGKYCGTKRTICFKPSNKENDELVCKMEVVQIICLSKHRAEATKTISSEFQIDTSADSLPRYLIVQEKMIFNLKVYIFQGKIVSGFDKTGLADTFVRVVVQDQVKETKTIDKCLNPIWDQVLLFSNICLEGSLGYIKDNVPSIVMEVYDKDMMQSDDFIGRTLVKPRIKNADDEEPSVKLNWINILSNDLTTAEVLCASEFIEASKDEDLPKSKKGHPVSTIPKDIKPELVSYKMEVLFWGMRSLKSVNLVSINRPRISVYCGDAVLHSTTMENAAKHPNFPDQTKGLTLTLATQREYAPPVCLKLHDSRTFGIFVYAGIHIADISTCLFEPITSEVRAQKLAGPRYKSSDDYGVVGMSSADLKSKLDKLSKAEKSEEKAEVPKKKFLFSLELCCRNIFSKAARSEEKTEIPKKKFQFSLKLCYEYILKRRSEGKNLFRKASAASTYDLLPQEDDVDVNDLDWWTKFHASLEEDNLDQSNKIRKLKIYNQELEKLPEFKGFTDMITSFEIYKGKRTGDEILDAENVTGVFKGSIKIYRWPPVTDQEYVTIDGTAIQDGVFKSYPQNIPKRYVLRVYCIRGLNLRPKDLNGRSDPYLYLTLNNKVVNDKEHVLMRQLNPVFGRCFEFSATFPQDHMLTIAVWDYDAASNDDLIGQTNIDLEHRYYTKYRAHCGLPETYEESGYCSWRDSVKPTNILSKLCRKLNIEDPEYGTDYVRVGSQDFSPDNFTATADAAFDKEVLALSALRRWKEVPLVGFELVPEHVETRSLHSPERPGIEQGKLQLWIDIIPVGTLPPPKKVDITPRKPEHYELRVIVWNTADVLLEEDDFLTGERKSDIYVKGWLTDSTQAQYTDVHYRSLTGEGNFNWRFVFSFEYLATENKLLIRRKEGAFAMDETEIKLPCKLTLQVWDNDTFSKDDFIGALTLELSKLNRGAKHFKKCNLSVTDRGAPTINLFKTKRTKGWWPFRTIDSKTKEEICAGKIEAELELLTREEATRDPAGLGRHEPQALQPPKRPDTSFSWFRNPLYAIKYALCKIYKWKIITCCLFLAGILFVALAFYAFPGYTIKRILGA